MRVLAVAVVTSVLVGLLVSYSFAAASRGSSLVVDRTLVCAMGISGGIRKIEVTARSGTRDFADPTMWKIRAGAEISNPYGGPVDVITTVSAGAPPPGGLSFIPNPARCKQTTRRASLSTRGLTPHATGPFDDEWECQVSAKIQLRIRGIFREPTSLRKIWADPRHSYRVVIAGGEILEGRMVARTLTGKPIASAAVFESGKAQVFTARGCIEG